MLCLWAPKIPICQGNTHPVEEVKSAMGQEILLMSFRFGGFDFILGEI